VSAAAEGPADIPRDKDGRPKRSHRKKQPAGDVEDDEPDPLAALTAPVLAKVAQGLFAGVGGFAGATLTRKLQVMGYAMAPAQRGGAELAAAWKLSDEEANAIGHAARRYIETLTEAPPPWLGLALSLAAPLLMRGGATYAVFHGLKRQNGPQRAERAGEESPSQTDGERAPSGVGN